MKQQMIVIDDSPRIHALIDAILADDPVDIQHATDPKYGLVLAASTCPDLILLDVDMPEMDGFEVARQLKADPATAHCPIIFLTAMSEVGDKLRGFHIGAADYIAKPFVAAELQARVRASLRTHRLIGALEETAMIDPLTGLGNDAMFVRRIAAEVGLHVRKNNPFSIIMMEIHAVKTIRDTYGNEVCDKVLREVGEALAGLCRAEDVPCRVSDGRFGIVLPQTIAADALVFARRICQTLAEMLVEPELPASSLLADEWIRPTASCAVAQAAGPYDRSIIQRADEALDSAMERGGNVVLASGDADGISQAA